MKYAAAVMALAVAVVPAAAAADEHGDSGSEGSDTPALFVVDTSGSMWGTPLAQAKEALHTSVDALEDDRPAGLRSYGGNCGDGGILQVPIDTGNRNDLHTATDTLTAGGGTPTPDALLAAADDLPEGAGTIVLISDGQSGCGDPCVTSQDLADEHGIDFQVHTVGFQAPDSAAAELACIAEVTGGTYVSADDEDGLADAIGDALTGGPTLGNIVAMGDSYTSGEGTRNYTLESARCHRSPDAWAENVRTFALGANLVANLACSGAVINDITRSSQHGFDSQFVQLLNVRNELAADDRSIDTIMLTIGGNDLGFASVLSRCFQTRFKANERTRGVAPNNCINQPVLRDPNRGINRVMDRLEDEVVPLLRGAVPEAEIVLVGYPRIFPANQSDVVSCGWLFDEERWRINGAISALTVKSYDLADATGITFVNSINALEGNELCTSDSLFHPISSWGSAADKQQWAHPESLGQFRWAEWIVDDLRTQNLTR